MTDELDELVRQYLDGDLSPEREAEALHRIASDPEARELLRFELETQSAWTPGQRAAPPEGFVDQTMEAIEAEAAPKSATSDEQTNGVASTMRRWWQWLATPRPVPVRPAAGLAVALLLVALSVVFIPDGDAPETPAPDEPVTTVAETEDPAAGEPAAGETVWTRFMYLDEDANSVAVAGDFSDWDPIPLSQETVDDQAVWSGLVPVPPGEHQYMFVIDDSEWVTDPLAPQQREDGFGNKNAVLHL